MLDFAAASGQHAYIILAPPLKIDVPSITPVTFCSGTVLLLIDQTDIPIAIGLFGTALLIERFRQYPAHIRRDQQPNISLAMILPTALHISMEGFAISHLHIMASVKTSLS